MNLDRGRAFEDCWSPFCGAWHPIIKNQYPAIQNQPTRNKDSWCVVLARGRLQFPDNLQPQWPRVEQSIFHELCQEVLQLFTTSSGSRVDKIPDKHGRTLFNQCRICQKGIPRMLRLHRWSPDPLGRLSLRLPELLLREGGLPNPWLQRDSSA